MPIYEDGQGQRIEMLPVQSNVVTLPNDETLMLYTDRPPELGRHEGYPDQSDIRQTILYPIPVDLPEPEEVGSTTLELPMTEEGKIVGLWHPEAEQWFPVYYSEGIENNDGAVDNIKWTPHGYKHFPSKNKKWNEIVVSTKNGPSKYKPEIQIEELERALGIQGKSLVGTTVQVLSCETTDVIFNGVCLWQNLVQITPRCA